MDYVNISGRRTVRIAAKRVLIYIMNTIGAWTIRCGLSPFSVAGISSYNRVGLNVVASDAAASTVRFLRRA